MSLQPLATLDLAKANGWPTWLQVRVDIAGPSPTVWRRLLLPLDLNLAQLHHVLQAAFAWQDERQHEFHIGGLTFGPTEWNELGPDTRIHEARDVQLADLDVGLLEGSSGPHILYDYDLRYPWRHALAIERWTDRAPLDGLPLCLAGARAGPPEGNGGPRTYDDGFLEEWRDPHHPNHTWAHLVAGEGFDPDRFAPAAATTRIRAALDDCGDDYGFRRRRRRNKGD